MRTWLLRRDDEVGCAPFWVIDRLETRRTSREVSTEPVGDGR